MSNGAFFQSAVPFPSQTQAQSAQAKARSALTPGSHEQMDSKSNEAPSALAEAIDDFLGDLERKFKAVSDEILTKCKIKDHLMKLDWRGRIREAGS